MAEKLTVAIQKNGRLNEDSLNLLLSCGLLIEASKNGLFYKCENLPIDLILVRDDDIPALVANNVCDIGIVGKNVLVESEHQFGALNNVKPFRIIKSLGFGGCRLSLSAPTTFNFTKLQDIAGLKIATSYPYTLKDFLVQNSLDAEIVNLAGSVEIAPRLKVADLICDLVATGETLRANNLQEITSILTSEAVLFQANQLSTHKQAMLEMFLKRLDAVLEVKESKYIMFHLPKAKLNLLKDILPDVENPSIMKLSNEREKVAIHVVSQEKIFWETLERLKEIGASSILVLPIEKMMR
jgi:ATP phosphoribosyltransferase